ncbi:UNVERIFIED_CONTAM: hypothetical protein Slati_2266400, partial [Sesamum latifolium]
NIYIITLRQLKRWMYHKNLSGRARFTLEFEDGVKTFIEWAKCQRGHMDGGKIRCPCRKCNNTKFITPDDVSYHRCGYQQWAAVIGTESSISAPMPTTLLLDHLAPAGPLLHRRRRLNSRAQP